MQRVSDDAFDEELLRHAHPIDWVNPTPQGRYDLVAIGGGTAGIAAALTAAEMGARVALVERRLLGGHRLSYGAVPRAALVRSARAIHQARTSLRYGVAARCVETDFARIIDRMRQVRAEIGRNVAAARLRARGIDLFFGDAQLAAPKAVAVGETRLEFRRAILATGARPLPPEVPGLAEAGCLTPETMYSIASLPKRLIVLGGDAVGCDIAQAFCRCGCEVQLVENHERLLNHESPEASIIIRQVFEQEGIRLYLNWRATQAERMGGAKSVTIERGGERLKLIADEILARVGRRADVEGLGLETAGVRLGANGVEVDDYLRTTNPAIRAAGGVCAPECTHAAAYGRLAARNALQLRRKKANRLALPRCTMTDPEVAHVGWTAEEAAARGVAIDTFRAEVSGTDAAVIDDTTAGFATVHVRRGSGRIVGATIVGNQANELIGDITLAMTTGLGLGALAGTIHCQAAHAEILQRVADGFTRARRKPRLASLVQTWFARRR